MSSSGEAGSKTGRWWKVSRRQTAFSRLDFEAEFGHVTGKTNGFQVDERQLSGLFRLVSALPAKMRNAGFYLEDKADRREALGEAKAELCCRMPSLELDSAGLEN